MHAVIFVGGILRPGRAVTAAIEAADLILAASGAATALRYQQQPAMIIGDFDSLPPALLTMHMRESGRILRVPAEKDETDTELAIRVALEQGAQHISLLGGFGGARFDHAVANLMLLADFPQVALTLIDGPLTCRFLHGPAQMEVLGQPDDLLSLFPFQGDVMGISTQGLYYPLHEDTLSFGKPRGISNKLTADQATIRFEQGLLLVMHTDIHELRSIEDDGNEQVF